MIMDLNFIQRRGRWYVYHRHSRVRLLAGFVGTREDAERHLEEHRQEVAALVAGAGGRLRGKTPGWRTDAANALHIVTMRRAARKKLEYQLSPELIYKMLDQASDRCSVSGIEMDYLPKRKNADWHRRPLAPSIDRIDNSLGYVGDNIRIVCASVNIAINEWGLEQFLHICSAVVEMQTKNVLQKPLFPIVFDRSKNVA